MASPQHTARPRRINQGVSGSVRPIAATPRQPNRIMMPAFSWQGIALRWQRYRRLVQVRLPATRWHLRRSVMRRSWTRGELIVAFNLYCKLRFGQCHARNPYVIELARVLDRTPSAVAMKLCNFASFDPAHRSRGVRGLGKASRADREVWDEFNADWNRLAVESELAYLELLGGRTGEAAGDTEDGAIEVEVDAGVPTATEAQRFQRVRLGQSFFRAAVLSSYRDECCMCGLACRPLLVASHIVPWSSDPTLRLDPRNGLALCALHDKAFDRGYLSVAEDFGILVSPQLDNCLPPHVTAVMFREIRGKPLRLPEKFQPYTASLAKHRATIYRS